MEPEPAVGDGYLVARALHGASSSVPRVRGVPGDPLERDTLSAADNEKTVPAVTG
jgi:hypothetical protein